MELDFCFKGEIPPKYLSVFNKIAYEVQSPYTQLIESVSQKHRNNLDWWISCPAGRHTLSSPLFLLLLLFHFASRIDTKKESVSIIVVDSKAFKKTLERYLIGQKKIVALARVPCREKDSPLIFLLSFFATS